MQAVSNEWISAQQQIIVPESFVEISYLIGEPNAAEDSTVTDNGHWEHSNPSIAYTGQQYTDYITLGKNAWVLDGTKNAFDASDDQKYGFVSSLLSNESAQFTVNPLVSVQFLTPRTTPIPGITITWSTEFEEYAWGFIVTAYNGDTVTATKTVTGNTQQTSYVEFEIPQYDKITIEITDWCFPYHRARIEQVSIGLLKVFDKSTLLGFEHTQFVDPLSFDLPKSEVIFEISNVDKSWTPNNPTGISAYLAERQKVTVRYGFKLGSGIEWIRAGTFYLSEWETPQNGIGATFTARDAFGLMDGFFDASEGTFTLSSMAESAFQQADLPALDDGGNPWLIDSSLESISVVLSAEDVEALCTMTRAEVVQLCANAACCIVKQNREGVISIEPFSSVLSDYIVSQDVSYENAEYELSKPLKSVDVNSGLAVVGNSASGEVQTMENPLIQNENVAASVANWVKDCLKNRNTLSGGYRADPRLDPMDVITVENEFNSNTVIVTEVNYTYSGAFRGNYKGRVIAYQPNNS